ncbi:MAG: class II glutamine amidotransferase [Thermoplasmata archaeon]
MCRMVGVVFRSSFPTESLTALRGVAETGTIPEEEERGHRDGWGIVSFSQGSPVLVGKSERPAHLDPSFDSAMSSAAATPPPNMVIAHVRAASAGSVSLANTHPFISGRLVLAHNGTVKGTIPNATRSPKGDTDSEKLLLLVADRYSRTNDLVASVVGLVREDLKDTTYRGLVLLVSDGSRLVGFRKVYHQDWEWYYKLRLAVRANEVMLFQEVPEGCAVDGQVSEVVDGELVSIEMGLDVTRTKIL